MTTRGRGPRLPTYNLVFLSTSHITIDDHSFLANEADPNAKSGTLSVDAYSGGLMIVMPDPMDQSTTMRALRREGYSGAFQALIRYAIEQHVNYIRLDRDGEIVEELPMFNW